MRGFFSSLGYVRELAKSNKYQMLYNNTKDLHFRLFENDKDFTQLQVLFLNYLQFYYGIYYDIALGDVEEIVLDNDIYEDSYVYWKRKTRDKQRTELREKAKTPQKKSTQDSGGTGFTWLLKSPRSK